MANTNVTMRIDENLKSQLQELVSNLGLDMTTFFTMAAKQAVREQALPFKPDMNKTGLPIQDLIEYKPNEENKDFFFVQGVGKVKLDDAMDILTREGKEAVKKNEISLAELGGMYKCRLVQNKAKCGSFEGTFNKCWMRIPASLKEYATVEDLATTVDTFNECYADGMNQR